MRIWTSLERHQWALPGRCLVCVCSNDRAAHCWTSVEWKNILLCCLLPFDASAGLAVLPKKTKSKEIFNIYHLKLNDIVLLVLPSSQVGSTETLAYEPLNTSTFGLLLLTNHCEPAWVCSVYCWNSIPFLLLNMAGLCLSVKLAYIPAYSYKPLKLQI